MGWPVAVPRISMSLLPRLECAAQLLGERSESLWRRGVRAFGVLAHFLGLPRVQNRLVAQTNAPTRQVDVENDDLDVGANRKRFRHVGFPGHARFAQRHETRASR